LAKLVKYGFDNNYEHIIVTWGWTDEAKKQADEAGIKLWDFREIMLDIVSAASGHEYFNDDTLRTLQLFVKSLNKSLKEKMKVTKSYFG
jgi:hypothetical protein